MSMNGGFQTDPRETAILLQAIQTDFLYPLTIGLWLDATCLGLLLVLLSHYLFTAYKKDNVWVRGLVGYLLAVALVATALMVLQVFVYVVKGFGTFTAFSTITCVLLSSLLCPVGGRPGGQVGVLVLTTARGKETANADCRLSPLPRSQCHLSRARFLLLCYPRLATTRKEDLGAHATRPYAVRLGFSSLSPLLNTPTILDHHHHTTSQAQL